MTSADSYDELDPATGAPLNQERISIRRARLRAETQRDALFGALELDGNTVDGATARLLAAQVGWHAAPSLTVTVGLFKTPFGVEVPAPERDKAFLEPPAFARALFPGSYDAGVMVHGAYGLARYALAIVNGSPSGDAQWRGTDPSSSYDVVGRIGASVEGPRRFRIEAGVSGLRGTGLSPGTPPTKDDLQWIDQNQDGQIQTTELVVVPGTPGTSSVTFERQAIGADLAVHWCVCVIGTGTAFLELASATNLDRGLVYADPVRASRDLRHLGFSVGAVQAITDHAVVGVRYDRYAADRDRIEQLGVTIVDQDQVFSTLSIMATGRWGEARLVAQYDRERNPFGRADDGAVTTREADRFSLRAQVGF